MHRKIRKWRVVILMLVQNAPILETTSSLDQLSCFLSGARYCIPSEGGIGHRAARSIALKLGFRARSCAPPPSLCQEPQER